MADTFISPLRMLITLLAGILLAILVGCQSGKPAAKAMPSTTSQAPANEPSSIAIVWPSPTAS